MGILDQLRGVRQPASNSGRDIVEKLKSLSPNNVEEMTSDEVSRRMGRFVNDVVGLDKARSAGRFPLRFMNVVIPEADLDDFNGAVRPVMDKVLPDWADALRKCHGEAGASLISELAEERGHAFRAGPIRRTNKFTLPGDAAIKDARQKAETQRRIDYETERKNEVAQVVAQAVSSPSDYLKIQEEAGVMVAARIRTDWDTEIDPNELLEGVLKRPGRDSLRRLTLGVWDCEENSYDGAIAILAKAGPLPGLVDLHIGDFDQDEMEVSWTTVGDVSPLYAALPNLKVLCVHGCGIELGRLEHESLTTLRIHTGGLSKNAIASINEMNCPSLEHLEWWFGAAEYGGEGDIALIEAFLQRTDLVKLRYLGLQNAEFSNDIAKRLVSSPLAAQITTLDLSLGTLTDAAQTTPKKMANVPESAPPKSPPVTPKKFSRPDKRTTATFAT